MTTLKRREVSVVANPKGLAVPDYVMIEGAITRAAAERVAEAIARMNHLVVCGAPQLEHTEHGHPVYVATLGHARAGGVISPAGQVQFMILTDDL